MTKKLLGTAATVLAIWATNGFEPAKAQTDQAIAASGNGGLEEIVVTARRKEEKLQSVPVAITAFTAADLQAREITDQYHLTQTVPSLITYDSTTRDQASFAIRGQASTYGGSAGVLTYFDEVPSAISAVGSYYDLENVQVLKGPQGTLFGGTATGGAVLFETAKPKSDFEGYAQVTFGSYNWQVFEGAVNIPIVEDKVLLRIAGNWDERDGYTKDVGLVPVIQPFIKFVDGPYYTSQAGKDYDNLDDQHARVSLLVRPTDDIENLFVARYDYLHTNGVGQNIWLFNPTAFTPGHILGGLAPFAPLFAAEIAQQAALGPRQTSYDDPTLDKDQLWQLVDQLHWDATDYLTVRNIVSYAEDTNLVRWDEDATPFPFLESVGTAAQTTATITEELQVQGRWFDDALHTTVGFFEELTHNPNGLLEQNGQLAMPNAFFTQSASLKTEVQHEHAGYGQGTYDLGRLASVLEGAKFTGGVRYTWVDTASSGSILQSQYAPFGFFAPGSPTPLPRGPNCFTGAPGCFSPVGDTSTSTSHLGWTLQLEDQIDPTTFVYVRAGKAFQPGGVNVNAVPSEATFQSQYLQDVEIGLKKDWAFGGMKARTNVALFHGDYSNIQRSLLGLAADGKTPIGLSLNVGDGTIEGVEFEGALFPGYGLEFDVSYANTQSSYNTFASAQLKADLQGVGFPYTPKNKYSVTGRYHLPLPEEIGDISIAATYSYQDRVDVGLTNITSSFPYLPSSGLLDAQVDWTNIFGQTIDATAFVTNATDQTVAVGQQDFYSQLGFINRTYGEPRMWGVRLKYRFGGPAAEPEAVPAAYTPPPVQAPVLAPRSYLVFFDFNKSDLTQQATEIVDQAAKNAGPAKVTQLTVTGHTDTVGSDAYNMRLSRRRAESVAAQLEKDGIPSSEIEIVAKGKRDLLVPTGDGVREPQNRRVQIVYDGAGPS